MKHFIVGVIAFCYIHSFNHMMKMYKDADGELTFLDYVKNTLHLND